MRFSSLVDRIGGRGADAWTLHFQALEQRSRGRDVILLTVGDPDQGPPGKVIEATIDALRAGKCGYAPVAGLPELRAAIAARMAGTTGRDCTAENVVVVPGAQAGLFSALHLVAGPGDEVIVPEPIYATYEAVIGACDATMVTVPLSPERNFHPDPDTVARAITPRTRAIWINNPHNPTGAVLSRPELEAIAELCRRHDLWLIADEVYATLTYARPPVSVWSLDGMRDRAIVVSSLSKSHAAPGFRLGWMIADPLVAGHMFNLLLCMTYGGPPFIQEGALAAVAADLPEALAMNGIYRRRAARLVSGLAGAPGCRALSPEGGMFVLLDIRQSGLSSKDFAERLLEREGVAALSCDGFGPSVAGHLRLSLTVPDDALDEAGRRIVRFARSLVRRAGCSQSPTSGVRTVL
ncbi:pyridoxal phosphate-dependent aminotransferase [Telmatospirillum siberiense]|uniref:Aminotransferase n=1 Tax=Telmatospirillum siberiense TaxID=382514 RepID=A0A2N3PQQ4_9PROT|nr:pyridoxal phosphate-dependent aminotransferase [Telmatospirillum siberiense]PKU22714.1 arginine--pyruvate aminotransferase AruH [Telmatospirillum siberiense]